MCMCTQYSATTCGHSWISLTHQCGPFRNLLTCPILETFQTIRAPPFTCPECHAGFQDEETLRMIGGGWAGPAMIADGHGGHGFLGGWGGGGMMPGMGFGGGPCAVGAGPVMPVMDGGCYGGDLMPGAGCCDSMMPMVQGGDCCGMRRSSGFGFGSSGRRSNRRVRHSSHHYSDSSPAGCTVM